MAKIRNDYEHSWWPRLLQWLEDGSTTLDDELTEEIVESHEEHTIPSQADAAAQEAKLEERRRKTLEDEQAMYDHAHQWSRTKGAKLADWAYRILSVVICVSIIWVLLQTASYLPPFGSPDNPVNNEVSQRYIEKGMEETGAVNIVAGMILDYRAFDTLGESNVLFIAACSVLIRRR